MIRGIRNYVIMGVVCCTFLLGIFLYASQNSYAIVESNASTRAFPSQSFTSNVSLDTSSTMNLVQDALNSQTSYQNYFHNFDVVRNFATSDNSNPLYSLMKNLKIPTTSEEFAIIDDNPSNVDDKGILYILSHGYNSTNSINTVFATNQYGAVTDNSIKQYITQIALWLYLYENKDQFSTNYCIATDTGYSACDFYATTSSLISAEDIRTMIQQAATNGYQYLNYILMLVDNAKSYQEETSQMMDISSANLSYVIASDGQSLVTTTITPGALSNVDNYMYYTVELNDPNNYGAYLLDENDQKITSSVARSGSFKVYVPFQEDLSSMDLSSIQITITGYFVSFDGRNYRVTSSEGELINTDKTQVFANVLFGYVPVHTVSTSFNLINFAKFSKLSATNSEELPGATLVVTNKNDSSKTWTWVSTHTPHYLYLEDGDYELCETIAPEGYALETECIDFSIEDQSMQVVTMTNHPVIEDIPNTSSFVARTLYFLGGACLLGGLGIVGFLLWKDKKIKVK